MEDRLKILVVDDDPLIRELIQVYLEEEFMVIHAENGLQAIEKVQTDKPSLVLLDIMLPVLNGWEVCKQIRTFCQVPIIMVSAKGEEIDKILGLELGAEDYITKPFSPRELLARVKAQIRRSLIGKEAKKGFAESTDTGNSISDDFLNLPGLQINFKKYQVLLNGLEVDLTAKEFDLLAFLTRNRGQVFTREQLVNKVWGFDYVGDTRAVDSAIKRLRKKINNEEKNHIFIHTVRGIGYSFEVPNQ